MPNTDAPVRNSVGDIVGGWTVRLWYDEAADLLRLTVSRPSSRWLKASSLTTSYPPTDIEDALAAVQVAARTLGARRLF